MKKLIPIYFLLTLMVASIVTFGILMLRSMSAIKLQLANIEIGQSKMNGDNRFRTLQVEVVNTPRVEIDEPLKVTVDEPLSVSVDNEPDVHCANCYRY